jgi:hypothetical protein
MACGIVWFSLFSNETLGRFKDIAPPNWKAQETAKRCSETFIGNFEKKLNQQQLASYA